MNQFSVSITPQNTVKYPLHQHAEWEIMYYTFGEGYMATADGNLPFKKGSIIIIPPKTEHGSVSKYGFENISVGGDFSRFFIFNKPVLLSDNESFDGANLAKMIYSNRHQGGDFLQALCNAYACFLLKNIDCENQLFSAVKSIAKEIENNFCDACFTVATLLKSTGYAEDYIRSEFKKVTGYSPIKFLNKLRIERAISLLEIYYDALSVSEVACAVGFNDAVYFTKTFKKFTGVSPTDYKLNLKKS
jgi:AraC-like DNA-binding protein